MNRSTGSWTTVGSDTLFGISQLVGGPTSSGVSDGQLLERFAVAGEEAAFDAIMRRHGRMVLGVCRRVLPNENDVEDTFQATFLLLVRKARLIRKRESVGSWLHGVAYRLAVRSRTDDIRRRIHEQREIKRVAPEPAYVAAWRELQDVLDEELQRLPEKYRLPLVLCYLEGETQEEVAQRLGWPVGTVKGRVAQAGNYFGLGWSVVASRLAPRPWPHYWPCTPRRPPCRCR